MNNILFIKKPLDMICKDGVHATSAIKCTFDTFPIFDYILQSIFLRMTGCLEQKVKLIIWEMASYDLDYRYKILTTSIGECSTLEDKRKIFKRLWEQILKFSPNEKFDPSIEKYLKEISDSLSNILTNSCFSLAYPQDFENWKKIMLQWLQEAPQIQQKMSKKFSFLDKHTAWKEGIEATIRFRNTLAHNTKFPLKNNPALNSINNNLYIYENYFIRFSLLMLIDLIFRDFFNKYLNLRY